MERPQQTRSAVRIGTRAFAQGKPNSIYAVHQALEMYINNITNELYIRGNQNSSHIFRNFFYKSTRSGSLSSGPEGRDR